jgi:hypothetical protein
VKPEELDYYLSCGWIKQGVKSGKKHSEETKLKMSLSKQNMSEETKLKMINNMVKTRTRVKENGLTSYQEGAKKGTETRKNTILENGLTIEEDATKRSVETRKRNYIKKYGSLEKANKILYTGANNAAAKRVILYDENDNIVKTFDTRLELINSELPNALDKTSKSKRLYSSFLYNKYNKNGKIMGRYKKLLEQDLLKYKGWYIEKTK